MSHKFDKNRSVSFSYCKIPLIYTGIFHPNNKSKELVLMDRVGKKHYTACWRNNERSAIGIEFLLTAIPGGFIFKDKEIKFSQIGNGWVW